MMLALGWLAACLMGGVLGLLGGGGSILTVPILVYLFRIDPVAATGYSLFIVGLAALVGSARYLRRGEVEVETAVWFGGPSILGVYASRRWVVPALPEVFFAGSPLPLEKGTLILVSFALLMLMASYPMIRGRRLPARAGGPPSRGRRLSRLAGEGALIGVLTGFVGAGGGFLIIPALVLLSGLPMKTAVGTSLTIIAMKSLLGFVGELQSSTGVDWTFLLAFSLVGVVGMVGGTALSGRIPNEKLKPAFGWFVFAMGTWMLVRETLGT
jgi:uncharacterized membrane protein YfcA